MCQQRAGMAAHFVVLALSSSTAFAAGPWNIGVAVTADDTFESELKSCLYREIRNLGDAQVVDKGALYTLAVVALNSGGGYSGSLVILDHTDGFKLLTAQRKSYTSAKEAAEQIRSGALALVDLPSLGRINQHVVLQYRELDRLCKNVVATLDVEVLQVERQRLPSGP